MRAIDIDVLLSEEAWRYATPGVRARPRRRPPGPGKVAGSSRCHPRSTSYSASAGSRSRLGSAAHPRDPVVLTGRSARCRCPERAGQPGGQCSALTKTTEDPLEPPEKAGRALQGKTKSRRTRSMYSAIVHLPQTTSTRASISARSGSQPSRTLSATAMITARRSPPVRPSRRSGHRSFQEGPLNSFMKQILPCGARSRQCAKGSSQSGRVLICPHLRATNVAF